MSRFDWLETGKIDKTVPELGSEKQEVRDANYYLQEAEKSYDVGAYEKALRLYTKVLEEDPTLTNAWVGQVRCLVELNEPVEAEVWSNKAIDKFGELADLLAVKAIVKAKMYEIEEALKNIDKAMEKKNPDKFIWFARGYVLLRDRDTKNAQYCFNKVLEGNSMNPNLNLRVGSCFLDNNEPVNAKSYLDKAINLSANNPLILHKLAQCCLKLGLDDRGRYYYEKCLRLAPEFKQTVIEELSKLSKKDGIDSLISWIKSIFQGG